MDKLSIGILVIKHVIIITYQFTEYQDSNGFHRRFIPVAIGLGRSESTFIIGRKTELSPKYYVSKTASNRERILIMSKNSIIFSLFFNVINVQISANVMLGRPVPTQDNIFIFQRTVNVQYYSLFSFQKERY